MDVDTGKIVIARNESGLCLELDYEQLQNMARPGCKKCLGRGYFRAGKYVANKGKRALRVDEVVCDARKCVLDTVRKMDPRPEYIRVKDKKIEEKEN